MPCWELFEEQPADYRDEVLPPEVRARLSVEPGVALGWKQWVGDRGDSISIEHFGASAPGDDGARAVRLQPSTTSSRARRRCWSAWHETRPRRSRRSSRSSSPGFALDGELPAVEIEGIEVRHDGHAIARVAADGRVLPIRFTFDEGKIARVEVL